MSQHLQLFPLFKTSILKNKFSTFNFKFSLNGTLSRNSISSQFKRTISSKSESKSESKSKESKESIRIELGPQSKKGTSPSNPLTLESLSLKSNVKKTSWISSASLALEGFKEFIRNNATVISMWMDKQKTGPLTNRKDIHMVLQLKRDWTKLIPSTILLLLPGTMFLLPAVITLYPALLPSFMERIEKLRMYRINAIIKKRKKWEEKIRNEVQVILTRQPDSIQRNRLLGLVRKESARSPLNDIMYLSPYISTTLSPLKNKKLSKLLLEYLDNPLFTFISPQARFLQAIDWIQKDDILIKEVGVTRINPIELHEALLQRGFSIEEWKECQRNQLNGHLETMYKFQQLLQKNEGKGKGSGLGSSGKGNVKNMMDTGLLLVLVRILSTTQKTASK